MNTTRSQVVGPGRLFLGSMIDGGLVFGTGYLLYPVMERIWEAISGRAVEPPVIGFMSDYSAPAQNGYWMLVCLSVVIGVFLSALCGPLLGASPGKALLGVRYADRHGNAASVGLVLRKTAINIGLFFVVALPGPILGFMFGDAADPFSMLALIVGLVALLVIALRTDKNGLLPAYRWSGIVPIRRMQL